MTVFQRWAVHKYVSVAIRKSANFWPFIMLDLRTFRTCGPGLSCRFGICGPNLIFDLRICRPWAFFADFRLPQVRKYILSFLTNITYKSLTKIYTKWNNHFKRTTFRTFIKQSCGVFGRNFGLTIKNCGHLRKLADLRKSEMSNIMCPLSTTRRCMTTWQAWRNLLLPPGNIAYVFHYVQVDRNICQDWQWYIVQVCSPWAPNSDCRDWQ